MTNRRFTQMDADLKFLIRKHVTPMAMRVLEVLLRHKGDGPITAIAIAEEAGLAPTASWSNRRRAARKKIQELRELKEEFGGPVRVCARVVPRSNGQTAREDDDDGYWWTPDHADFVEYLDRRNRKVAFGWNDRRRQARASGEQHAGQQMLFDAGPKPQGAFV